MTAAKLVGITASVLLTASADALGAAEIPAALESRPCSKEHWAMSGIRSPRVAEPIDRIFQPFERPDRPGAMVAVIRHGEVVHLRGYGNADLAFGSGWTPATRYRLASITKTFTAAAVLELVDRGQIRIDAPVTRYLTGLPSVADNIRIGDLLTMSSGLWEDEDLMELTGNTLVAVGGPANHMSVRDMEAYAVVQDRLDFQPGTVFRYVDTNFRLLARVIETVTGKSYAAALHDLVLAPARMRDSAPYPTLDSMFACQVPTYVQTDGRWSDIGGYALAASGDGAMISTMRDMVAWSRYMSESRPGRRLSRYVRQADFENRIARPGSIYRLGIMVFRHRGYVVLVHQGATGTLFAFVPDLDLSVIIFANGLDAGLDMSDRNRHLASQIIDVIIERSERTDLRSPLLGVTATALPLSHSALPSGVFPTGTFLCESSGEVLDIADKNGASEVALMGMRLSTWERSETSAWRGMASHLQVYMTSPAEDSAGGKTIELQEGNPKSNCRFAVVEPRSLVPASAAELLGGYYSDTLKIHYRIMGDDLNVYLVPGNGVPRSTRRELMRLSPELLRAGDAFLRLSRTATGNISGFSLSTGRVRNVQFRKLGLVSACSAQHPPCSGALHNAIAADAVSLRTATE